MEITIKDFKEKYLEELRDGYREVVQNNAMNNTRLVSQMKGLLKFLAAYQKKTGIKIGEIQISLLQTSVFLGEPQIAFTV